MAQKQEWMNDQVILLDGIVENTHVFSEQFEKRQRELIEKVRAKEERKKIPQGRKWVAAAALVLAVGIPTAVGASGLFKMENMLIQKEEIPIVVSEESDGKEPVSTEQLLETRNLIALAVPDSPEWKAAQEWEIFNQKYQRSYEYKAALSKADKDFKQGIESSEFSKYPDCYGIITQDMAEELERICKEYNLVLESTDLVTGSGVSYDDILNLMQLEDFIVKPCTMELEVHDAYPEGDWHGEFDLLDRNGEYMAGGQISVHHCGVLDSAGVLNVGEPAAYEEWDYTNKNNDRLSLALDAAEGYGFVFYDTPNDFVEMQFAWDCTTKEQLETLVDSIIFSNISKPE